MEYVSDFTIEQFWKERYGLSPKDILKKAGARWRHEILNETYRHFTDSCFRSNGKFRTDFTVPGSNEIKSKTHNGVTGYTSIKSMKKLEASLKQVQYVREKLIDDEVEKNKVKEQRLDKLQKIRGRERTQERSIER